jgi:hypothetical protein
LRIGPRNPNSLNSPNSANSTNSPNYDPPKVTSAFRMAASPPKEIRYVAIARRSDNVIVSQHMHVQSSVNYVQSVKGVLGSPGWARLNSDRLTLDDGENTFYVLIDDAQRVYIVVVAKAYPARLIYDSADGKTEGFLSGSPAPLLLALHGVLFSRARVLVSAALQKAFVARFGDVTLTCAPDELTSRSRTLLKELCTK